jgi:polyisoprenoid-binding protein YceI
MNRWMIVGLLLMLPGQAWAGRYVVDAGSKITFVANHPTHEVHAESKNVSGELAYEPAFPAAFTGVVGKPIQAPWSSFDSGNANRDANMRSAVGAQAYPNITFVPTGVSETMQSGTQLTGKMQGRLYINGVRREISVPVTIELADPAQLRVRTSFSVKMTDYKIDPPSLLFVKTDDDVVIGVDLVLTRR